MCKRFAIYLGLMKETKITFLYSYKIHVTHETAFYIIYTCNISCNSLSQLEGKVQNCVIVSDSSLVTFLAWHSSRAAWICSKVGLSLAFLLQQLCMRL